MKNSSSTFPCSVARVKISKEKDKKANKVTAKEWNTLPISYSNACRIISTWTELHNHVKRRNIISNSGSSERSTCITHICMQVHSTYTQACVSKFLLLKLCCLCTTYCTKLGLQNHKFYQQDKSCSSTCHKLVQLFNTGPCCIGSYSDGANWNSVPIEVKQNKMNPYWYIMSSKTMRLK